MLAKLFDVWEKSIDSAELLSLSRSETLGVKLECFHANIEPNAKEQSGYTS